MGDPKFSRRKYNTPSHPWQKERIDSENELIRKYGLKNKTELWKVQSLLRQFRQRSRILQAQIRYGNQQARKERDQLLKRLENMGILGAEGTLDDVLGLEVEAILTRRLQTMAYMKGLSTSPKQARQFIVHGHVSIGDRKVTIPGYLVKRREEGFIEYLQSSPIANDMHPARPKDELDMASEPIPAPSDEATKDEPDKEIAPAEKSNVPDKTEPEKELPKEKDVPEKKEPDAEKPEEEAKPEESKPDKPAKKDTPSEEPKPEKPVEEASEGEQPTEEASSGDKTIEDASVGNDKPAEDASVGNDKPADEVKKAEKPVVEKKDDADKPADEKKEVGK